MGFSKIPFEIIYKLGLIFTFRIQLLREDKSHSYKYQSAQLNQPGNPGYIPSLKIHRAQLPITILQMGITQSHLTFITIYSTESYTVFTTPW